MIWNYFNIYIYTLRTIVEYQLFINNMWHISWHFMSSGIAHDYSCNFILWWPLLEQTNKAGRLRNGSSQPPRPLREDSVSQWTLDFDQDRMIMDDGCSTCFLVSTFSILFYTSNGHIKSSVQTSMYTLIPAHVRATCIAPTWYGAYTQYCRLSLHMPRHCRYCGQLTCTNHLDL
jgi:hypothetical protein